MIKQSIVLVLFSALIIPHFVFASTKSVIPTKETGTVYYITDGDTIKVKIGKKNYVVRLIGTDTPETKDPRKAVQCFGKEASNYTKKNLINQTITLESDIVSGNKDIYGRYLRYVILSDGTNYNQKLIADGYAYEYTYKSQLYRYRKDFKQAQIDARTNKLGLWADNACKGVVTPVAPAPKISVVPNTSSAVTGCVIKGNISGKDKIYHLPGCQSYKLTVIDESVGEYWFCTEAEAVKAGWRKAKNC